mmetsp:Transcript_31778/g.75654  ORF Transcript_31778/g.75654 Transcript_31778/m.75654 type:complete len:122 (-) Transcript_31778:121-486(-)
MPTSATVPPPVVAGTRVKEPAAASRDTVSEAGTARSAAPTHAAGEPAPEPMEDGPAPISEGAFEEEVSAQMTAGTRAALVQRRLAPTSGGLVESMIEDVLAGAPRNAALGGDVAFSPAAGA